MLKLHEKNPLQNEKGISLMLLILAAGTLVASVVAATSVYFANLQSRLMQQRDRIYAIQVLQDFSLQAQRANDNWVQSGSAMWSCAPGYIMSPANSPFCWHGASLTPSTEVCVPDPRSVTGADICMDTGAASKMTVAQLKIYRKVTPWNRLKEHLETISENRKEMLAMVNSDLNELLNPRANAVLDTWMPALTGAPNNDITTPTCNGVTLSDYCKVCGTAGNNLYCVEMRLCLDSTCSNTSPFARYFRQRIGIIF